MARPIAQPANGWSFTDASFHDIGSAQGSDVGRGALFPSSVSLRYAFKTPTLRDVARRGPYMHDGSVQSLEAVIDLYDRGGIERPSRAEEIHPLGLTMSEKSDLIAFLNTLNGTSNAITFPVLPRRIHLLDVLIRGLIEPQLAFGNARQPRLSGNYLIISPSENRTTRPEQLRQLKFQARPKRPTPATSYHVLT